jgi:alkylation response protein AidB-like acyl-CoA dehydrogenase
VDLDFSKEDEQFRERVRSWLEANQPREARPQEIEAVREFDLAWQRTLYDAGWAGISWPKEYGGCGLSLVQQMIWHEETSRSGAPDVGVGFVGMNHGGPTLIECANEEQKSYHLPKILRGEVVWCQGFSEPNAGSDLASLQCRAEIDGDHMVVNGQKIWTSYGNVAEWQELLVRTDPDASKHGGITWTICDMSTPGIEVRPIPTMVGASDFCEVFYTDVRIPLSNVVGDINDGWRVTMATLSFERGTAFISQQMKLHNTMEKLIEFARKTPGTNGRPMIEDDEIGRRLAEARAEVAALRSMTYATISRAMRSTLPGPEGSMVKLFFSELAQRIHHIGLEALGPRKVQLLGGDPRGENPDWVKGYLGSFAMTLGGGTSEIQRNIIGERFLGLPREPR